MLSNEDRARLDFAAVQVRLLPSTMRLPFTIRTAVQMVVDVEDLAKQLAVADEDERVELVNDFLEIVELWRYENYASLGIAPTDMDALNLSNEAEQFLAQEGDG